MTRRFTFSFLVVLALVVALVGPGAQPAAASGTYTITDLGTLGGTSSVAYGINAAGQVVGGAYTAPQAVEGAELFGGLFHAFLWQNGAMADLGTLGGASSSATAINAAGQVVGESTTASRVHHAFLWQKWAVTDVGSLGSS